jgi:hypothetical protein
MERMMQSCKRHRELLYAGVDEISFTDIAGWISTKDLKHPFVVLNRFPPFAYYLHHVIQYGCWEGGIAGEDSAALRV